MCLTSSFYPIKKGSTCKMFRDTAASKETMEFWSEVETPSQNSTKSCHSKVHVLPEYIIWEKNIAFKDYCSFRRYTLENCLAVGVWGLYFKNLLFKFDMFDYSEGRGSLPLPPGISKCTKTLHLDIIFFSFG